jgi:putative oxidoreductase
VFVVLAELLGSAALLVGLFGRLAAASIGAVMLGAVALVHLEHGFFMNWSGKQAGEGFEYHLLALALAAVVLITGSGALSADRAIEQRSEGTAATDRAHVGITTPDMDATPSRR